MAEGDYLADLIERLRDELHQLVKEKGGMADQEVVEKSRELDRLIVEYTRRKIAR